MRIPVKKLMRNSILDVLRFLIQDNDEFDIGLTMNDKKNVVDQLQEMGFDGYLIKQAFGWIQNLSFLAESGGEDDAIEHLGVRYYVEEEVQHLPVMIRGYIMSLEQTGILNTDTREMVINQLMFLEPETIDLDLVKWVTRVVLNHCPVGLGWTIHDKSMVTEDACRNMH